MSAKREANPGAKPITGTPPAKLCETCRYWSDLVARKRKNEIIALCLKTGAPFHARFCRARDYCPQWADGSRGSVDDPDLPKGVYDERCI